MQYVFRVNVHGQGYSLYTCEPGGDLQQLALDMASSALPANFIEAQRHVDSMLDHDPARPHLWASSSDASALALFGCVFPDAADQYGRKGIALVYGFGGHTSEVDALIERVLTLVARDFIIKVGDLVSRIATGRAEPGALVSMVDRRVGDLAVPRTPRSWHRASGPDLAAPQIRAIVPDSDETTLAWQAMTLESRHTEQPWAVFDEVDPADNRTIVTRLPERRDGPKIRLSDYIRLAAVAAGPAAVHSSPPAPPAPLPWWAHQKLWIASTVMGATACAALILMLVLAMLQCVPDENTTTIAPGTVVPRRAIAQYDYQFNLPDGWFQTGGEPSRLGTEIMPVDAVQDAERVAVEEQRAASRADVIASLRARRREFTAFEERLRFAERDVVHYQQTLGNKREETIDWYLLFGRDVVVRVGCQNAEASAKVQAACRTVVHSMVITG